MSSSASTASHPPSSHPEAGHPLPARALALQRAEDIHLRMLQRSIALGLAFEDRSQHGCHIYLAHAAADRMWNLSVSIDFSTTQPGNNSKPNVRSSINLMYGRKEVYSLVYEGRHDFWVLSFDHDADDSSSWDQLPFRQDIANKHPPEQIALRERWTDLVDAVVRFYVARQAPGHEHLSTSPPPASLPPGSV